MGVLTSNPAGSPKVTDTTPRPHSEAGRAESNDFDRFEALTGKLVQVPKDEVDKKRKAKKQDS
jgi:hypothetical protein